MLVMTVKLWYLGYVIYLMMYFDGYAFGIWLDYILGHVVGELMR
jgi:hypothetical protein